MTLLLKTTQIKLNENNCGYEMTGITDEDIKLAQEVGLLDPVDDFEIMIDKEQEFINEGEKFIDELEISENPQWFEIEGIYTKYNYIYYNIPVRINTIKDRYAFGSIDGEDNVYIPKSLIHNISLNELASINLIYKESGENKWKAIKINKKNKCEPVLVNELIIEGNEEFIYTQNTYHIPRQDIGKMIGRNGNILKKVIKNYLKNNSESIYYFNPEPFDWNNFDEWYDNANIPSLDINNIGDYTEVKLYNKIKITDKDNINFDPVKDFIMKLYC